MRIYCCMCNKGSADSESDEMPWYVPCPNCGLGHYKCFKCGNMQLVTEFLPCRQFICESCYTINPTDYR